MSNLVLQSPEQEVRALREGWAVYDQSGHGRLRIRGADRIAFLHNLTTNDVKSLRPGKGHSTVLPTVKGRILDWATLHLLEDAVLLVTQPQARAAVLEHLEFYHFMEDVEIEDLTESSELMAVSGPASAEGLDGLLGARVASQLEPHAHTEVDLGGVPARLLRFDRFGHKGFRLWCERGQAAVLVHCLRDAGAAEAGPTALEWARVAAGEPAFGPELNEERNALEAGLYGSLSFSKGCYLGQEVIARLDTYHKVARFLVHLRLGPEAAPELVDRPRLLLGGLEVGWITSWAPVPGEPGYWALGYTSRRCHGVELMVNGQVPARVHATLTTAEGDGGPDVEAAACH